MITRSDIITPEADTVSAMRARLKPRLTPPAPLPPALPPLGPAAPEWDRKRISFWPVAAGLIASLACLVAAASYTFGGGGLNAPGAAGGRPEWKLKIATAGQPQRHALADAEVQRLAEALTESERQRRLLDARLTRIESYMSEATGSLAKPAEDARRAPAEQPVPAAVLGADLGLVRSIPAARARWGRVQSAAADPGLSARLIISENGGETAQIRLLAGPFADQTSMLKFCRVIQAPPQDCRAAPFQGQTF